MDKNLSLKELTQSLASTVNDAIENYEELDDLIFEINSKTFVSRVCEPEQIDEENSDQYSLMELLRFDSEGNVFPDYDTLSQIAGEYL